MKIRILALLMAALMMMLVSCGNSGKTDESGTVGKDIAAPSDDAAVYTEHFSLTLDDMKYLFGNTYQNFLSSISGYGMSPDSMGIDTDKSLKEQTSSFSEGTLFDYFLDGAIDSAVNELKICEAAYDAGFRPEDIDTETLDTIMASLDEAAESNGQEVDEYIESVIGKGVKRENVEKIISLSLLANMFIEDLIGKVDTSDAALETEYSSNPDLYDSISYIKYTFSPSEISENDILSKVMKLKNAESYEEFTEDLSAIIMDLHDVSHEEAMETIEKGLVSDAAYSESDELSVWGFSANKDDVYYLESESGITLAILTSERSKNTSVANVTVRHALFLKSEYEDSSKAEEVYNEWVKKGASEDDFIQIVTDYSGDSASVPDGGLYENVTKGTMVEEFENWIFDPSRVPGDHGIVETTYGWHLMYFIGSEISWKYSASNNLKNSAYQKLLDECDAKYDPQVNREILDEIDA